MIEAYKRYWKGFVDFSGRSRRFDYWTAVLFNIIVFFVIAMLEMMTIGVPIISLLFILASVLPSLAISVRRMHDIGRSGLWVILAFIPLAGIVYFIFTLLDSQPGANQYGANPIEMQYYQQQGYQ
jgi:Predicted membrane protein